MAAACISRAAWRVAYRVANNAYHATPPPPRPRSMFAMSKKVSAKEKIVGFYSTGPRIRPADINIDALFR